MILIVSFTAIHCAPLNKANTVEKIICINFEPKGYIYVVPMHSKLSYILVKWAYTPVISVFIHTGAEMNFKVQTYTVNEGETVNLKIELDKDFSCDQREVFCIQTMDGTATGSAAQDCAVQVW